MRYFLLPLLVLLLVVPATAGELVGVELDDKAMVGDEELMLNGMGLRKKAIFKVYVGGFYLPAKNSDASAVLDGDTSRMMVMEFLRNVGADDLCGGWDDGLENNTPGASADVKGQFKELCAAMEDVAKGDQVIFTYQPDAGTAITVKGQEKGSIAGKEFADALFACWLGDVPPSEDFKDGILGG